MKNSFLLRKRKMMILAACGSSFLLCGAAATATFAWYKVTRLSEVQVKKALVVDRKHIANVTYYDIFKIENNVLYFDKTKGSTEFSIGEYNRLLSDYDNKHQLLVAITANQGFQSLACYGVSNNNLFPSAPTYSWNDVTFTRNGSPLSSIVSFAFYSETTEEGNYLLFTKTENPKTFVQVSADGTITDYSKDISIQNPILTAGNALTFYIVLDYSVSAIESIYSSRIGDPLFSDYEGIGFACDFALTVEGV